MEKERFVKKILPYKDNLLDYAAKILNDRDEATDIVQDVFAKLWHMRGELDSYQNTKALSVVMVKRLSLNRVRSMRRNINEYEISIEKEADEPSPLNVLLRKDTKEKLLDIFETLPSLQQSILRMRHIDEMEIEEISEITGCSHEAVRINLSRARKKVREQYFKAYENE